MEEYINKISQMSKEDSIKTLFKAGIVDENGKLRPEFRKDDNMHLSLSVLNECKNLFDSYGEICVQCNCCGRFNKENNIEKIKEKVEGE